MAHPKVLCVGEVSSRYTVLFEAKVIDWLLESSVAAVARQMKLNRNTICGIQSRAVKRGLARRDKQKLPEDIGVDEVSAKKGYGDFFTIASDPKEGKVLHIS